MAEATVVTVQAEATASNKANFLALVEQLVKNYSDSSPWRISREDICLLLEIAKPKEDEK